MALEIVSFPIAMLNYVRVPNFDSPGETKKNRAYPEDCGLSWDKLGEIGNEMEISCKSGIIW